MIIVNITLIVILLALSFIFSGSETSFFSISEIHRRKLEISNNRRERLVAKLLRNPGSLLVTILAGNMLVNITLSTLITNIGGVLFAVIIAPLLLLMFGEVTPKTVAVHRTEGFAKSFVPLVRLVQLILTPIRLPLEKLTSVFLSTKNHRVVDEFEMKSAIEESAHSGKLTPRLKDLTQSALSLDDVAISDLSINHDEFILYEKNEKIDIGSCFNDKIKVIIIYDGSESNIHKVYTQGDYVSGRGESTYMVMPEYISALNGFSNLTRNYARIMVLIDEHGTISGVVFGEKLLTIIFTGKLEDEEKFQTIGESTILPGSTDLDKIEKLFDIELASCNSKSIGGLITETLGRIPDNGENLEIENLKIKILKSSDRNIETIAIKKANTNEPNCLDETKSGIDNIDFI